MDNNPLATLLDYSGKILNFELFRIHEKLISVLDILSILLLFVAAIVASRFLKKALARLSREYRSLDESTAYNLGRIGHYCLLTLALILSLAHLGLDFTNIAIIAGALGVGIGFGLQTMANNFISGLIILFERNLNVGDFVELTSGLRGTIREINVRSSVINTQDNLDVLVPNSEMVSGSITNWTLNDKFYRLKVPFSVAYGSDKEQVKKAVLEAAKRVPATLDSDTQQPDIWLVELGDNGLGFNLVVWVDPKKSRAPGSVKSEYLWEIESSLREYNIEVPFPQRVVHLRPGTEEH